MHQLQKTVFCAKGHSEILFGDDSPKTYKYIGVSNMSDNAWTGKRSVSFHIPESSKQSSTGQYFCTKGGDLDEDNNRGINTNHIKENESLR